MILFVSIFEANYLENWKCFAVLKGDGSNSQQQQQQQGGERTMATSFGSGAGVMGGAAGAGSGAAAARYLQLGPITNAQQVPWH